MPEPLRFPSVSFTVLTSRADDISPSPATIHKSQHPSSAKPAAARSAQRVTAAEAAWRLGGASGLPFLHLHVGCVPVSGGGSVCASVRVSSQVTFLTWNGYSRLLSEQRAGMEGDDDLGPLV